jgi:chemotaxis protein MotB
MVSVRKVLGCIGALLLSLPVQANSVVKETVLFIDQDGRNYLSYTTSRTGWERYSLYLPKREQLEDFLYIYPNEYRWDAESDPQANILNFPQSDFATITPGRLERELTVGGDGTYRFTSWQGEKRPDGHFGFWTEPGQFAQFVYVWVLPANFEFIRYQANRPGEWVQRHNTLAFYAKQVNDLTFTIDYRPRSVKTLQLLQDALQDEPEAIQMVPQQQGVNVTLRETLLFPSGSSELSNAGKRLLARLAKGLQRRAGIRIVVSGHSDNVPISGELRRRFASNWELSAARAIAVVHQLETSGFPGSRLEVRAYGEHQPRADNATAAGRQENRRIELEIIEAQ